MTVKFHGPFGGGQIPQFNITEVTSRQLKLNLMNFFDRNFNHPVAQRDDFEEIFSRIDTRAHFLLAYQNKPLGYAAVYCNDLGSKIAYLTMIGVVENAQHCGIGGRLLQEVEDMSRRYGMTKLQLEVWKDNNKAQRFYQHHGFELIAKESETSFFMSKQL